MADEIGNLPRGPARVLKAAVWSWQGLCAAWKHESSFRLEVYLFVVLAPLALWRTAPTCPSAPIPAGAAGFRECCG